MCINYIIMRVNVYIFEKKIMMILPPFLINDCNQSEEV